MSDELRAAAAERLRRDGYSSEIEDRDGLITGNVIVRGGTWDDVTDLADAWLAEHDPELVTEEWLKSVGFRFTVDRWESPPGPLNPDDSLALMLPPRMPAAYYGDDNGHWVDVPFPATRGAVRRLLAALGIEVSQ